MRGKTRLLGTLLAIAIALLASAESSWAAGARGLLDRLQVAAEQNDGYSRAAFKHWIAVPGKGCDVRDRVLYRQDRSRPRSCGSARGSWVSPYDNRRFSLSSKLDVDHTVPLAEAWGSGARAWSAAQRRRYANDLHRFTLIAVSASSNRSKADRDPAEWLPPRRSYACRYLAHWVAVKHRWRLAVDPAERDAIGRRMSSCSRASLTLPRIARVAVPAARPGPAPEPGDDPRFSSCVAAKEAGYGPYVRGRDPEYEWYRDGDGDGTVCE